MRRQAWVTGTGRVAAVVLAVGLAGGGCGVPVAPAGIILIETATVAMTASPPPAATATLTATISATTTTEPTPVPPTATWTPEPTASATPVPAATDGPTPDAAAHSRQLNLPILMYHYVEPWPPGPDQVRQGLTVRPEDFAAQMGYLHGQGYVTVSLYDLVAGLASGKPLPEKAVVITFDDGYRGLVDFAAPVLEQYGYTATVFVITQLMDEGFEQYLTWDQALQLHAAGWMIEPHTKTHDQLAGRGRDFQLYQMLGSIQTVEAHIGRTPRFFAYPSGKFDELSVQLAKELHLWGAVTVNFGRLHTYDALHTLSRVRVSGTGTLEEFAAALGHAP